MRVAVVRSDLAHFYLADVENSSQRNFSSEPAGQSRYFHKPTDAELTALLTAAGVASSNLAALKAAVYPTASTVDVSSATVGGVSGISALSSTPKAALVAEIQNLVAPQLVETGPALLSFAYGQLSKLASASFDPGGSRTSAPPGAAVAIVHDDGVTPFTL